MLRFGLAVIFLLLAVTAVVLEKSYNYLPARELRRRADAHDAVATVLWRAVAYGASLRIMLWTVVVIGSSIGFVLLTGVAPTLLAIIAVGLLLLVTFAWLPNTRLTPFGGRLTLWLTPVVVWVMRQTYPLFRWTHGLAVRFVASDHTGLFERADLIDLLEMQKLQPDNRILPEELDMAAAALGFGDTLVRSAMVPRKKVRAVSADESVGPMLLDELHKSKHARFPVHTPRKPDEIVGTLYLLNLTAIAEGKGAKGTVAEQMDPRVVYVHQNDTLADALHTFYQTKQQLFVVINSFEEYVGILTLEDIFNQLIGQTIVEKIDQPESLGEVAARHPKKKAAPPEPVAADTTPPASETDHSKNPGDPQPSPEPEEPAK